MGKKTNKKNYKKNLKAFLTEEEGKMTKKDILKLGAMVIAAGAIISKNFVRIDDAQAGSVHGSHASHASHGSHGSGGGCGGILGGTII